MHLLGNAYLSLSTIRPYII
uniref:Uncharacterized protein n=1 Tax=Lepeophtheirus salmonis TaxID=72036 RepID=A0A0K2TGI6_LEPSM